MGTHLFGSPCITIEANLTQTDFLDVTLDLTRCKHFPYRILNSDLIYINRQSNHPPSILKQLPQMIQARLSNLSSDEGKFTSAKFSYEALKKVVSAIHSLSLLHPILPHKSEKDPEIEFGLTPPSVCTCPQT